MPNALQFLLRSKSLQILYYTTQNGKSPAFYFIFLNFFHVLHKLISCFYFKSTRGGIPIIKEQVILTVGSMTYAIKAKRILARAGIRIAIKKLDKTETKQGCAYGIEIPKDYLYTAVDRLKEARIPYSVYEKN